MPKFILLQPRELPCYFNELNILFQDVSITDKGIKKAQACWYVDIDKSELWQVLPDTLQRHMKIGRKLYLPSTQRRLKIASGSMANLDQLLRSTLHMGIMNSEEYAKCYCKFFNITQFLIRKLWLSESEQSHLFQWDFQPSLLARIEQQLKVKIPNHYPGNPYKFEDIKEAATHVLRGMRISSEEPRWAKMVVDSTIAPVPASVVKGEDISTVLEKFAQMLVSAWQWNQMLISCITTCQAK